MAGFTGKARRWTFEVGSTIDGSFRPDSISGWFRQPRVAISVLRDRTPAPPIIPLKESQVQWGGPSSFDYGRSEDLTSGPSLTIINNKDDEEPPPPDDDPYRLKQFDEVERKEKTVRITGTGGAYVDFARIEEITFRGPDEGEYQMYYRFTMKDFGDQT